ncbi:43238_t:CDS:1, partial [Gigaspora margarita]
RWVPHNINAECNLCQAFLHLSLVEYPSRKGYIASCTSYISLAKYHEAPVLSLSQMPWQMF